MFDMSIKNLRIICLFAILLLFGCSESGHYVSDKDFIEISREYSPNKEKVILVYNYDTGAFGYSRAFTAILDANNLENNLLPNNLPDKYYNAKWLDNNTVETEINIISDLREGLSIDYKKVQIENVTVIPKLVDTTEDGRLKIEDRIESPDGKLELIAYRYAFNNERALLQISIIGKGTELPRIGNYFIGTDSSDYVFNAEWKTDNEIQFETNSQYGNDAKYYFVKNRPPIKYTLNIDDNKYKSKYVWKKEAGIFPVKQN